MTEKSIELAAKWIHDSQNIVILTGAGVSKESGVPTYRDALTGLYAALRYPLPCRQGIG